MKYILSIFVFWIVSCKQSIDVSQSFTRTTVLGMRDFTEYKSGNLPIIFTAPHGGSLKPTDIPDRNCTGCVTTADANTQELIRLVDSIMVTRIGCYPHTIINRLHRVKMDANREIVEAANGNILAQQAWREYTQFIETAKQEVLKTHKKGLLIDLHGHGHTAQRLELGYLLDDADLRKTDSQLITESYANRSSIRSLITQNLGNIAFPNLLRGDNSLGTLFQEKGYPAVPSKQDVAPKVGELYFSGGYTTQIYGSEKNGELDAIQIECNFTGVRDTDANRKKFASTIVTVIQEYMRKHYWADGLEGRCVK